MKEDRSDFTILTGAPAVKRQKGLGLDGDNIQIDFKELDINTRNWIDQGQGWDYRRTFVSPWVS